MRYCLRYAIEPAGDTIRLAAAVEWDGSDRRVRAVPYPVDPRHTPALLARTGVRRTLPGDSLELRFGGAGWQYVYIVRLEGDSLHGRGHVVTDLHLDRPVEWRVAGVRCTTSPAAGARR